MTTESKQKITIKGIFAWCFGILFALLTLSSLITFEIIPFITYSLISLLLIPPVYKKISDSMGFDISTGVKILLIFLLLFGSTYAESSLTELGLYPITMDELGVYPSYETNSITKDVTTKTTPAQNKEMVEDDKTDQAKQYFIGDTVIVGDFSYIINSVSTTNQIGESVGGYFMGEKADGMFIVLDVTIENIGDSSTTIFSDTIKIVDSQFRTYSSDTSASIYLGDNSLLFEQYQPGLPKTGKIVFDVPQDIKGGILIDSNNIWSSEQIIVSWSEK